MIEAYKKDVDRTLLRENLKLTSEQRVLQLMALLKAADELRRAGRALRAARCLCLGLRKLIEVKRAAGRPKDLQAVADLEALLEERDRKE